MVVVIFVVVVVGGGGGGGASFFTLGGAVEISLFILLINWRTEAKVFITILFVTAGLNRTVDKMKQVHQS